MDRLSQGRIVPGERISSFRLGISWDELRQLLSGKYTIEQRHNRFVVKTPSMWFFINDMTRTVIQITVCGRFQGTMDGKVGIGSTLADLANSLGQWIHNGQAGYIVLTCPGIVFELDHPVFDDYVDPDPTAHIAYISIY